MPPATRQRSTAAYVSSSVDSAFIPLQPSAVEAMLSAAERSTAASTTAALRRSSRRASTMADISLSLSANKASALRTRAEYSNGLRLKQRQLRPVKDKENAAAHGVTQTATAGLQKKSTAAPRKRTETLAVAAALPLGVRRSSRLSSLSGLSLGTAATAVAAITATRRRAAQQQPVKHEPQVLIISTSTAPLPSPPSPSPPAPLQPAVTAAAPQPAAIEPTTASSASALSAASPIAPSALEAERKLRQHQHSLLPINTACVDLVSPTPRRRRTVGSSRRRSISAKGRKVSLLGEGAATLTFHGVTPPAERVREIVRQEEQRRAQRLQAAAGGQSARRSSARTSGRSIATQTPTAVASPQPQRSQPAFASPQPPVPAAPAEIAGTEALSAAPSTPFREPADGAADADSGETVLQLDDEGDVMMEVDAAMERGQQQQQRQQQLACGSEAAAAVQLSSLRQLLLGLGIGAVLLSMAVLYETVQRAM